MDQKDEKIEVEFEGTWGTVCNDGFDKKAAEVVCRSLGQRYGVDGLTNA